jgi:FAD/FMN-containing dehydrogenase
VHSVMAGRTSDNVHELDVVTYDGCRMTVGATSDEELERIVASGDRRGDIYRRMRRLGERYAARIRAGYPQIPRRVSGYNLDDLLPEKGFHVARALVGSEGTLVTVLQAKVRLVHSPPCRALLLVGYPRRDLAADEVRPLLEAGAIGLEGIDRLLIEDLEQHGMHVAELELLPEGAAFLLVEFGGDSARQAREKAVKALEAIGRAPGDASVALHTDHEAMEQLWEVREAGLGATAYPVVGRDHWPGWDDAAVPPARLGDYLRDYQKLLDDYDYRAAIYGHYGDGCVHCRIDFDLRSDGGVTHWRRFLDDAADLVVSYGGSLSGEHGEARAVPSRCRRCSATSCSRRCSSSRRSGTPGNRMNPHKVVDPYPIVSNLKLGAGYAPPQPVGLHFSYPEDGGSFAHAALRCVGAGACRDTPSGTMCPSYMVTRDEEHTTRGRARILYEMLEGDTIAGGFKSDEVHEALDLCLACKGCKGDCPVSVDMAT